MKFCASTYSIGRFGINQIDAIKKAKELGVAIISEVDFLEMIGQEV